MLRVPRHLSAPLPQFVLLIQTLSVEPLICEHLPKKLHSLPYNGNEDVQTNHNPDYLVLSMALICSTVCP